MVDRDLIRRRIAELEVYQIQIGEYQGLTAEEYRREWKIQRIVDRTFQLMIECCLDIANHIIADRRLRVPATYAEAFEILEEAGCLSAELREAMVRMSGFRNILVHEYLRTDPAIVVAALRDRLGDFSAFAAAILKLL